MKCMVGGLIRQRIMPTEVEVLLLYYQPTEICKNSRATVVTKDAESKVSDASVKEAL